MAEGQNRKAIPNLNAKRSKEELIKLCEEWGIKLEGRPPHKNLTKTDIKSIAEKFFGIAGEDGGGDATGGAEDFETQRAEVSYLSTDSEESTESRGKVPPSTLPKTFASLRVSELIKSQSEHSTSTPNKRPPPPPTNSLKGKGRGSRMSQSQSPTVKPGLEASGALGGEMATGSVQELMQAQMIQIQQLIAKGNENLETNLGRRYRDEMSGLREELILYVGEHTANKTDMDKLARRVEESEVNNRKGVKALEDASVRDREENSANYEALRKEVDEVKLALQNSNQGPTLNENQVASSVMSYMAMHEATRKNMVVMGIPETHEENTTQVVIKDLKWFFDSCNGMPFERVVREASRLGKKKDGAGAQPRMCKVCFTNVQYRDAVLDAAMRDSRRRIDEWNAWKAQNPTSWEGDHEDKPPFRRYFPDVPLTTRAKRAELTEVVQLVNFAGPEIVQGQEQLILSTMGNGDAKLLLAVKEFDGKWSSDMSGVRAEQYAAKVLMRFAAGKQWITRATRAYTRAGAYLPDVFPENLRGRISPWITRVSQSAIEVRSENTGGEGRSGPGRGGSRREGLAILGEGDEVEGMDGALLMVEDTVNDRPDKGSDK